jgi:predicted NAD-dependent protein-ADP-ribosyltransferase YbiA (DUF1768 family)
MSRSDSLIASGKILAKTSFWMAMLIVGSLAWAGCASRRTAAQKMSAEDLDKLAQARAAAKPPETAKAKSRKQSQQWAENLAQLYNPAVDQARREKYVAAHPETAEKVKAALLKGDLVIGMNADEARASWGLPTRVDKDAGAEKWIEQWRYGDHVFLSFERGKLMFWDLGESK